jgi:hypothetical protein
MLMADDRSILFADLEHAAARRHRELVELCGGARRPQPLLDALHFLLGDALRADELSLHRPRVPRPSVRVRWVEAHREAEHGRARTDELRRQILRVDALHDERSRAPRVVAESRRHRARVPFDHRVELRGRRGAEGVNGVVHHKVVAMLSGPLALDRVALAEATRGVLE